MLKTKNKSTDQPLFWKQSSTIKGRARVLDQIDLVSDSSSVTTWLSLNLSTSPFLYQSGQDNKIKVSKGCSAITVAQAPAKAALMMGKVVELDEKSQGKIKYLLVDWQKKKKTHRLFWCRSFSQSPGVSKAWFPRPEGQREAGRVGFQDPPHTHSYLLLQPKKLCNFLCDVLGF